LTDHGSVKSCAHATLPSIFTRDRDREYPEESKVNLLVQQYLNIIRRWVWLLLLASLISGAVAYWIAKEQPSSYQASARLLVGPGIDSLSPDLNALRAGGQLMQTYAELATTQPVLEAVIAQLNLPTSPDKLAKSVKTHADDTTQILNINVEYGNAVEAASVANAVADTLVYLSPSSPNSSERLLKQQVSTQIEKITEDINRSQVTIQELETQLQAASQTTDKLLITDRLAEERTQLATVLGTLSSLYETLRASYTNQVKIIERASLGQLMDSGFNLTVLMGVLAGLVLALAIVVAFEYFKDTIDTSEELMRSTRIPFLGAISKYKALPGIGRERLPVLAKPESQAAENYRMLGSKLLLSRYNMQFAEARKQTEGQVAKPNQPLFQASQPLHSVLISGTSASDDTSEIAANLAVVLAQTGLRVTVVDAFLHRPTLAQWFGIPNQKGLTDVLMTQSRSVNLLSVDWEPNLSILPSGPIPSNPFELLASPHMADLIDVLKSQTDIIIVVASPMLLFADSLILASRVDGVVLVAQSGKTRRTMVNEIVESLHSLDTKLVGTILNHNSSGQRNTFTQNSAAATEQQFKLAKDASMPLHSVKLQG